METADLSIFDEIETTLFHNKASPALKQLLTSRKGIPSDVFIQVTHFYMPIASMISLSFLLSCPFLSFKAVAVLLLPVLPALTLPFLTLYQPIHQFYQIPFHLFRAQIVRESL